MIRPVARIRLDKAAVDEGFSIRRSDAGDWLVYGSLKARATLCLTSDGEAYVAGIDHPGVATDLAQRWTPWTGNAPEGFTAFVVTDTAPLQRLVREMWLLAQALPTAPLHVFHEKIKGLPKATEAERLVVQRVGQDVFREALLTYWGGRCAVTGIEHPRLLRASHIRPWAKCDSDAERLNVYNGLLLAPHLDAAFDAGLISFGDDGYILIGGALSGADRDLLCLTPSLRLRHLNDQHRERLAWHREALFGQED